GEQPADEGSGLARPRSGLEHQGDIEPGLRGPAGGAVLDEKIGAEVGHAGSPPEPSPPAPLPSPRPLPPRARGAKRGTFAPRAGLGLCSSAPPPPGEGGGEGTGEGARG